MVGKQHEVNRGPSAISVIDVRQTAPRSIELTTPPQGTGATPELTPEAPLGTISVSNGGSAHTDVL